MLSSHLRRHLASTRSSRLPHTLLRGYSRKSLPSDVMETGSVPARVFPPLYASSGDAAKDRLAFFHILERLKTQKRTGWVHHNVPGPESISDHMYRMAVLAMCTSDKKLDISKCVMMAIVHDLAEAQVGDIAPREGIPKAEKQRLEAEAMHNFVHEMLHDTPAAQRIETLWHEYEEQASDEARFVKDLDRFEMACQALEYEKNHRKDSLQGFFDSSLPHLRHPEVQQWGRDLTTEREQFHESEASHPSGQQSADKNTSPGFKLN